MSSIIVMKFGGTSLADRAHMEHAVGHVAERARQHRIVVVVSAMGRETDRLLALSGNAVGALAHDSEVDVVVSAGEQVSSGLFALALQEQGLKARSFLGWQVPIHTQGSQGKAQITQIETENLEASLAAGQIVIVAGFQGLGADGRITTLGRGGSDISAVALAVALDAERCEIYTDVEGVFTADPQIVRNASRLDRLSYEEMVEFASLGAQVLQPRSVELAASHLVPLKVLPAYADFADFAPHANSKRGTEIYAEQKISEYRSKERMMEQQNISGVACSSKEAKITLVALEDRPGVAARIFSPLAQAGIVVDMIVQTSAHSSGRTDITFTVAQEDLKQALQVLNNAQSDIGYQTVEGDENVAKVSIVGIGMRSQTGIAETMFRTLANAEINIQAISTSEIKISVLVAGEAMEQAVRLLHSAYGLDS